MENRTIQEAHTNNGCAVRKLPYLPQELQNMIMDYFSAQPRIIWLPLEWLKKPVEEQFEEPYDTWMLNRIEAESIRYRPKPSYKLDMAMNEISYSTRQIFKKAYKPLFCAGVEEMDGPERIDNTRRYPYYSPWWIPKWARKILIDPNRDTLFMGLTFLDILRDRRERNEPEIIQFDMFRRVAISVEERTWDNRWFRIEELKNSIRSIFNIVHELFPHLDELIFTTGSGPENLYFEDNDGSTGERLELHGILTFEDLEDTHNRLDKFYNWYVPEHIFLAQSYATMFEYYNSCNRGMNQFYMSEAVNDALRVCQREDGITWEKTNIRICDTVLNMGTYKYFYEYHLAIDLTPDGRLKTHKRLQDYLTTYYDCPSDIMLSEYFPIGRASGIYPAIATVRRYICKYYEEAIFKLETVQNHPYRDQTIWWQIRNFYQMNILMDEYDISYETDITTMTRIGEGVNFLSHALVSASRERNWSSKHFIQQCAETL